MNEYQDYVKVQSAGFIAYCDCLIARKFHDSFQAYLMSITGTAAHTQALASCMFQNESCRLFFRPDEPAINLTMHNCMSASRSRKVEGAVNRVLASPVLLLSDTASNNNKEVNQAIIFGPDMDTIRERAFLRLNADTAVPLKSSWTGWLWDEVFEPEKLYSFGDREVRESYLVQWPRETVFQDQVLDAVKYGYLT